MLTVVGTQIQMHCGDDAALPIVYKNNYEEIHNFKPGDILTLTVKERDTNRVVCRRVSESVLEGDTYVSVIIFRASDAPTLSPNSYLYDLHLDTVDGIRYTLISRGVINILKAPTLDVYSTVDDVPAEIHNIYMSLNPLICKFSCKKLPKDEPSDTLILF